MPKQDKMPLIRRSYWVPLEKEKEASEAIRGYLNALKADIRNESEPSETKQFGRKVWLRFPVDPDKAFEARKRINEVLKPFKK